MSPLSAIRPSAFPEVQPLPPPPLSDTSRLIPTAELKQLSSASLSPTSAPERSFGSLFTQLVGEVNAKQTAAGDAVAGLLSGQNVSLHQAMIAMEEASVSFQLMVEVRNKLMEAYQELMRMQV